MVKLYLINTVFSLNHDEHELDYTHYAYREQPKGLDYDDIILVKDYKFWLKAVFDGYDEICRRMCLEMY